MNYKNIITIVAVVFCGLCGKEKKMVSADPFIEERTEFLDLLTNLNEKELVSVNDFAALPGVVFMHSSNWADAIFQEPKGPTHQTVKPFTKYYLAKKDEEYDSTYFFRDES